MITLAGHGKVSLHNGSFLRAKELLESALVMCRERRYARKEFDLHVQLARALCTLHQYEDAHSTLLSAQDLIRPGPTERALQAQLACSFGELSLAKGDYADALEHYRAQGELLMGEERISATRGTVLCLWLLGSSRQAVRILDAL